jgi:hypothetical protein
MIAIPIVAAILVGVFLFNRYLARLGRIHAQKLEAAAKAEGWTFRENASAEDMALINQSQLFKAGRKPFIKNVVETSYDGDRRLTLFNFSYISGQGKNARTTYQSVVRIVSPAANRPEFVVLPTPVSQKIGHAMGGTEIKFPNMPQFDATHVVRGTDEPAVRGLFSAVVVQDREQDGQSCVEGAGNALLVYRHGYQIAPEELQATVVEAKRIEALFAARLAAAA